MPRVGEWEKASNGHVPSNAVPGGNTSNGGPVYVARAEIQGELCPGKVNPAAGHAYVPHGGTEHPEKHYEVLLHPARYHWIRNVGGHVPHNAVEGGRTRLGEVLYIGRAHVDGVLVPGKVHPSQNSLHVGCNNIVHSFRDYEILVANV